ncbi:MAG: hypothetical protein U1F57_04535 [bacterium]
MKHFLRLLFPLFLFVFSAPVVFAESPPEILGQIQKLKDLKLPDSEKGKISRQIEEEGKTAIPFLIGCLKDPAPIGKTPLVGGECVNRPAYLPVPPQCQNPLRNETLGERCELLLYRIVTPVDDSPNRPPLKSKEAPPRPFVISDWNSWWKKYEKASLEQIHAEARKKIDEFWSGNLRKSVVWEESPEAPRGKDSKK